MKIAQDIYDQIAKEIENKQIEKGTWTRAVAESGGDKQKTEAIYINYRAHALSGEAPSGIEKEDRKKIKRLLSDSYLLNALSIMHITFAGWFIMTTGLLVYARFSQGEIALGQAASFMLPFIAPPVIMAAIFALRPAFGNFIGFAACIITALGSILLVESNQLFFLVAALSGGGIFACSRGKRLFGKNKLKHKQLKYMLDSYKWGNKDEVEI